MRSECGPAARTKRFAQDPSCRNRTVFPGGCQRGRISHTRSKRRLRAFRAQSLFCFQIGIPDHGFRRRNESHLFQRSLRRSSFHFTAMSRNEQFRYSHPEWRSKQCIAVATTHQRDQSFQNRKILHSTPSNLQRSASSAFHNQISPKLR